MLEKPIAPTETEVRSLIDVAREHKRIVMVCHILRYEPFYQAIQRAIADRRIGRLTSIQTSENVSYDHLATTFLRHPRNLDPGVLPMLLSKCCHDLDLIAWLAGSAGDASLKRVASLKTPTQFRPSNAPLSSTERCLDGCGVESTCRYSARALYVEDQMWDAYSWPINEYATRPADDDKLRILATTSPYGRCVWRCPNKIVDHQSVIVEFASGVTASHDLFCATSRPGRTIRVVGTDGELEGNYESGQLLMRKALRSKPGKFIEDHERVAPPQRHSQFLKFCESALIADFLGTLRNDPKSPGLTRIEDSLIGHQIAYAAESASETTGAVQFGVAAG
jgi:predicted dehydrogenase